MTPTVSPRPSVRPALRRSVHRRLRSVLRRRVQDRFGRSAGTGVVVLAVAVALTVGFIGAALAAHLGWRAADALPDAAALTRLAAVVTPGVAVEIESGSGLLDNDGDGTFFVTAGYAADATAESRDVANYHRAVSTRLTAAGWHLRETHPGSGDPTDGSAPHVLVASRDGLVLRHEVSGGPPDSAGAVVVTVERAPPLTVGVAGCLGLLTGAALGWLLAGWVSRRTEGRHLARLVIAVAGVIGLIEIFPAWFMDSTGLGALSPDDRYGSGIPAAGASALVVLIVAARCRPRRGERPAA